MRRRARCHSRLVPAIPPPITSTSAFSGNGPGYFSGGRAQNGVLMAPNRIRLQVDFESYDVLVVGGGLAGLRAAIAAVEANPRVRVGMVSKVYPMRSHTVSAEGGAAAVMRPEDSYETHAFDTIKGSDYLADQDVVEAFVREAPVEIIQMEHWGCPWSRDPDGKISARPFGGMTTWRTCFAADKTGFHMLHAVFQTSLKYPQITRHDEAFVTKLLVEDSRCVGVVALDMRSGRFDAITAKSVILATGGLGRIYAFTTNGNICTGDGMALAYRAGVGLKDMEMVQFHPTGLPFTGILITEAVRGEGGYLLNNEGERFLKRYVPNKMELGPRDIISRAMITELEPGRCRAVGRSAPRGGGLPRKERWSRAHGRDPRGDAARDGRGRGRLAHQGGPGEVDPAARRPSRAIRARQDRGLEPHVQHRAARGAGAGFHARGFADHRRLGARARRVPRRPRPARFSRARRRQVPPAHACIPARERPTAPRVPRRPHHEFPAAGEDLLNMPDKRITIRATRYDPDRDEKPRLQSYDIPFYDESMVVLDALNYIKSDIDGSLSYRWSCRMGICGSCGMMVNGTPKLTCNAFLRDYWPGAITVQPRHNFPLIRDLVIDMDDFMHKLKSIKPWIIRKQELPLGAGEHHQTNEQIDDFRQFSECINCMLCYAACPVYGLNNEFLGPAAIALARRYNLDSRDQGLKQRLPVIGDAEAIWECSFVGECSVVCPNGVDPAKAIQQTKLDTTMRFVLPYGNRE